MYLTFKKCDFDGYIHKYSNKLEIEIDKLIYRACNSINALPNNYTNPSTVDLNSDIVRYEMDISQKQYSKWISKANYNGLPIEIFILESIRMYYILYGRDVFLEEVNEDNLSMSISV